MNAPADKTAKRLSEEEWLSRYDSLDLLKKPSAKSREANAKRMYAPADRVAVRS